MDHMIGQRIKERRKELKITQTMIADQTSVSSGNLSCIENGKYLPSAIALLELSKILDCTTDWILTGESSISKKSSISDIEESKDDRKLLELFHGMSEEDQEELLMIAQMKYNRVKRDGKGTEKSSSSDQGQGAAETA